jgi:hypothetical protein
MGKKSIKAGRYRIEVVLEDPGRPRRASKSHGHSTTRGFLAIGRSSTYSGWTVETETDADVASVSTVPPEDH